MYSPGLPVLFLISTVNFLIIYWVDKWLLLRFYRTPKNFDETCIHFSLGEMKIAFVLHFFIGALTFSNKQILTGDSYLQVDQEEESGSRSIFDLQRYNSLHVIFFIVGNCLLILLSLFESTIFRGILNLVGCFTEIEEKFDSMSAISDDYYEVITLKFLISEYERAKQEKQKYLIYIEQNKNQKHFVIQSQALNKHIKRLKNKEKEIQLKFNQLCKLVGINEPSITGKIRQL